MSCQIKHPVSAKYEAKNQQYFSIVSLPTDSVIVDHAVSLRVEASLFVLSPGIETETKLRSNCQLLHFIIIINYYKNR
jgi:hypothetical protein